MLMEKRQPFAVFAMALARIPVSGCSRASIRAALLPVSCLCDSVSMIRSEINSSGASPPPLDSVMVRRTFMLLNIVAKDGVRGPRREYCPGAGRRCGQTKHGGRRVSEFESPETA